MPSHMSFTPKFRAVSSQPETICGLKTLMYSAPVFSAATEHSQS